MRRFDSAPAVLSAAWLAGCATSAIKMAPDRPDRPWTPATTESGEIIPGKQGVPHAANGSGYVLPSNTTVASVPPPPSLDSAKVYSLPELIDIAEANNPSTRIAWNEARKVALAAGVAESTYLPKVTASAVLAYVSGGSSQGSALGTGFQSSTSATGTISAVSLQWLLFDFGERAAIIDAARQVSVIANIAFTAAHQQLIYNVALSFYAHAAARARLATATQSLSNARAVQAAGEDRYQRESGTAIEVAQARQATAQANLALVQATGGAQDAYLALISAMGISPLTRIKVADASGRKLSTTLAEPVEGLITASLARRPDVLSAYAAQKASLANVRAAQAEFMPKVFVAGTGNYNSGSLNLTAIPSVGQQAATFNLNGGHVGGTILAGVTLPLYDGGTRSAALAQARAEADSAEARLTRVREDAVRQIVVADNALHTSLSAHGASEALRSAAQTTFDAALAAYRNGVGSITDLTLAQTQLLQARNATTDAYSTALSAAATLALATGALGQAPP
jgi:outer membrane protein TolC